MSLYHRTVIFIYLLILTILVVPPIANALSIDEIPEPAQCYFKAVQSA